MIRIGLTGGIGSGKSAVTDRFKRFGIPVIDSDILTRELVTPGSPALQIIVQRFGEAIVAPDGHLDRKALRTIIFNDQQARRDLESILHPAVREEIFKRLSSLDAPYCLVVVPLLVESGMTAMFERIIVVDCNETQQIERVMQRDGSSEQEAHTILDSQVNRRDRLDFATDIIQNTGDFNDLDRKVERLHHFFLDLAGKKV
jgi:dephospho-CoA kinase